LRIRRSLRSESVHRRCIPAPNVPCVFCCCAHLVKAR
jgi:hypothetical protein